MPHPKLHAAELDSPAARAPSRPSGSIDVSEHLDADRDRQDHAGLVLDLDPDLGSGIAEAEWRFARQVCRAALVDLPAGDGDLLAAPAAACDGVIAAVVESGLIAREHSLARHRSLELLCPGDVLLLSGPDARPLVNTRVSMAVLSDARCMILGRTFLQAAARWPSLMVNLNHRVEAQRERLAACGLAAHLPRVTHRILLTLWLLADQCGRVTADGIVLPLHFTQDVLSQLVAARRSTVTLALGELTSTGLLLRTDSGHLGLTDAGCREITAITATGDRQAVALSMTPKPSSGHPAAAPAPVLAALSALDPD